MKEIDFEYKKPPETENKFHRLDLIIDGENIGFAEMEFRNNPFPFYYIELVFVKEIMRGQGLGVKIVEKINEFLDEKGKPGILLNSISSDLAHIKTIYQNHVWKAVQGRPIYFTYKLPELPKGRLDKAIFELSGSLDRRAERF